MSAPSHHAPWGAPRLLGAVRSPRRTSDPPVLMAWLGWCASFDGDEPTAAFVSLHGELCAYSASRLRDGLPGSDGLLGSVKYARDVVIDLSPVSFLDTTGLELLEELRDQRLHAGGRCQLHHPSRAARRILDLVRSDLPAPCHQLTPAEVLAL